MTFIPSKYQEAIFGWFKDPSGPIAVGAVAGSGKTTTLVKGFNQMNRPGNKLFAAFNKSIVDELKKRLPSSVNCQTFHSLGYSALRSSLPDVRRWDIENGNVKYRAMARDLSVPASYGDKRVIQDTVLSLLNYAQLTLTPLNVPDLVEMADRFGLDIPLSFPIEEACEVVKEMLLAGRKSAEKGLISYSDMIYMPLVMDLNLPKYSLIAADECQDLNKGQMTLLMRAMATGGNFVAVGDRNQAIYQFAGAESDSFDQLKAHFSAEELELNYCYRCPQSVIEEAQKIVPHIECPEGTRAGIVGTVGEEKFKNMLTRGDMVLCRLTAPLVKLCFQLIAQRIPAKVRGRDIGAQIANTVRQIMKRSDSMSEFPRRMYDWQEAQLNMLRDKLGSEDKQQAVNDKCDCLSICYTMFKPHSIEGFCADISNLFSDSESPVTLCTVHRAKGLENPRVFIIKPEKLPLVRKGQTPSQIQQEWNLRYVAVTRAMDELYFVNTTEGVSPKSGE